MGTYAIIGGTLWGNRGAEAMVTTAMARTRDRDPDADFVLMSYMYQRDRQLNLDPSVRVVNASPQTVALLYLPFAALSWLAAKLGLRLPDRMLPQGLAALRGARALFDVSGISFHDGRLAVVVYNTVSLWPALLVDVPVVRLSQAMGPFEQPINRFAARSITRRSFFTFSRGSATSAFMRTLGVPADTWGEAADVAFAYRAGDSITEENVNSVRAVVQDLDRIHGAGRSIAVLVPSSLVLKRTREGPHDYIGLLDSVLRHLVDHGFHVLVMPNATSDGVDTLRNNDIEVIRLLREQLAGTPYAASEASTFVEFDLNTDSIRQMISRATVVITSRFHAMVAALALTVPTFIIGWSHKYAEVLEMFGCDDDAVAFTDPPDYVFEKLDAVLGRREDRTARIAAALPGVKASAEAQFDVLARLP